MVNLNLVDDRLGRKLFETRRGMKLKCSLFEKEETERQIYLGIRE